MPPHRQAPLPCPIRCRSYAIHCLRIVTPSFAAASRRRPLPLRSQTVLCRRAASCFAFLRPCRASRAYLLFAVASQCKADLPVARALPRVSRLFQAGASLSCALPAPRDAMPCLCVAPPCSADAQQCHAFALRCAAMLCPCTANQSRALPLPFDPMHPHCLAMPCNARASPITAFAVPIIAVAMLCVASPARCHPLPSPCFSPLSHRRAFPRSATAFRRSAPPSLICAHPRPCASLRRVGLPPLSWSILRLIARRLAMLRPRLALPYDSRVAPAFLVNPSPGQRFASLHLRGATRSHSLPSHIRSKRSLANAQPREATPAHLFASSRLAGAHLRSKLVYTAPRMSPASASAPVPRNFA